MTPEPAYLRDFARRYTAAWCSYDSAAVAGFFSVNGSLSINGAAPSVGRNAIAKAAHGFMTTFPDLCVIMDDLRVEGETAQYNWTLVGTSTGPGGTGHRVRISGLELWKLGNDGLIAESQGTFDSADYQRQLERGFQPSR